MNSQTSNSFQKNENFKNLIIKSLSQGENQIEFQEK